MAEERLAHPPVRWSAEMQSVIGDCIGTCAGSSPWEVAGYGIERTYLHLTLTYTTNDIDGTVKWLGQQMTKAVHQRTAHAGPVFCKWRWLQFVYDVDHRERLLTYIENHNVRQGRLARPYGCRDSSS